jgi:hypothetical protein
LFKWRRYKRLVSFIDIVDTCPHGRGRTRLQYIQHCAYIQCILSTRAPYRPHSIQIALLVRIHCTVVGMEIIQTNLFKN